MATNRPEFGQFESDVRRVDSKCRLTLPREFADATVIIEYRSQNDLRVRKARVIPEDELSPQKNGRSKPVCVAGSTLCPNGDQGVLFSSNVEGIPVQVSKTDTGKLVVRIGGYAIRKIAQWMGAMGWSSLDARQCWVDLYPTSNKSALS